MSTLSRAKTITIICWAVSAIALLGLLAWFLLSNIAGFGFDFGMGTFDPVGTHSVSADNIDSVDIDWTSGAVYIGTHHGDEIQITEFARRDLRDGEELSLRTDGGTLAIQFAERHGLRIGNTLTKRLEVLIPYTRSQDFDIFYVNTVSGRAVISDIHATDFTVRTTSGRIELNGITAQDLQATTTSGRIELRRVTAETSLQATTTSGRVELRNIGAQTLNATTTSGRIELFATEADEISLHTGSGRIEARDTEARRLQTRTTSGRHELFGSFDDVNARSGSGRIEILSEIVPDRVTAQATSGRIEVTVPDEGAISVQHSTNSGRFSSDIAITSGGADAQFDLSTRSGRISIFALR